MRDGSPITSPIPPKFPLSVNLNPSETSLAMETDTPQTSTSPRLLRDQFPSPIFDMQITEGTKSDGSGSHNHGMCLWVASGPNVYRYWLGQRDFL